MEFMTNLQSGLDEQKPSLFELLSEQQLAGLIPPSLRYLLAVATHRYPRYLLRILNSFDEVYALLSLLIERHYLRTYSGGFTENFYGLKREKVLRICGGELPRAALGAPDQVRETLRLRDADVWKNLAVMVALPYVRRKLDESYDIHGATANLLGPGFRGDTLSDDASLRQRIFHFYKWFLRRIYPSVNAAYYFALLAWNLAYLFDTSKFHDPFLWLIGTRLRRMNAADHKAIALATTPPPPTSSRPGQSRTSTSLLSTRTLTQTVYPRLLSSLKILLPTSIFALKFLEWWHASDFARQLSRKAAEGVELPAPRISFTASSSKPSGVTFDTTTTNQSSSSSHHEKQNEKEAKSDVAPPPPPISSKTNLPIFTVPPVAATAETNANCPICRDAITTPTAAQTGFVYCYTCIFKWVEGEHPRQIAFMEGNGAVLGENADGGRQEEGVGAAATGEEGKEWIREAGGSRRDKWEDGSGRCAVTGRRLLGGTGGLRRVIV